MRPSARSPEVKFEPFPRDARFALNVTHFLMLKSLPHHENRNLGHILLEDLASVYHAMESFDLLDAGGRIVLHQNVSITDHIKGIVPVSRSYPFFFIRLERALSAWLWGTWRWSGCGSSPCTDLDTTRASASSTYSSCSCSMLFQRGPSGHGSLSTFTHAVSLDSTRRGLTCVS